MDARAAGAERAARWDLLHKLMRTTIRLALLLAGLATLPLRGQNTAGNDAWSAVEEALKKGLPRTAIEHIAPILEHALAQRDWAQAARAIAMKLVCEGQIEGNLPEERIRRMAREIKQAPAALRPILHTIQAHWFWTYFEQNRWRFFRRTTTAEPPGEDFTTWDLQRLFAEIDRQFQTALSAAPQLQRIPIQTYDGFLRRGTMPDRYRPTLYDFIAHEALRFYTSGEQAAVHRAETFEITTQDPVFAPPEEFLAWTPSTDQTNAPVWRALELYQALLRFHRTDPDRSAFLDADLERLAWAFNTAFGEDKEDHYLEALRRFADRHAAHEIASLALHRLAERLHQRGDPAEAHAVAERGRDLHPDSPGGRLCAHLVQQIELPAAKIHTERVWNEPWPEIQVTYKNTTQVWFRLYRVEWQKIVGGFQPEALGGDRLRAFLERPPLREWSHPLPPTPDYREHTQRLPVPRGLAPGLYVLATSHQPRFTEEDNQVSLTTVWVSRLALVVRSQPNVVDGFVLQARTGEPIRGATVEVWTPDRSNRQRRWRLLRTLETDSDGRFVYRPRPREQVAFRARYGEDALARMHGIWPTTRTVPRPFRRTVFFTDRAIYRPGQAVQYKGICLAVDQQRQNYEVMAGVKVTVAFFDPNGQEIERRTHRCNDYGSFSGSFTAPADRVTGRMAIRVLEGPEGMTGVQVEEYKRPKFNVMLQTPAQAPRLEETVRLEGTALAYTGAAVDGAEVRWRVTRQVRIPWWCRPLRGGVFWPVAETVEIAHGSTRTGVDGHFEIEFTAVPDRRIPASAQPTFIFRVQADVTDAAGETRSGERFVRVGYVAMEAQMTAKDWLPAGTPFELKIKTADLDGQPQSAEGVVRIHRLQTPPHVIRARLTPAPENEPDPSDPENWPLGEVVREHTFQTGGNGETQLTWRLPVGAYRAVLETKDRYGQPVKAEQPLWVIDPNANQFDLPLPLRVMAPRWKVEPGETFTALWGSGYPHARAFVEIVHRGRVLQSFWTNPGQTQVALQHTPAEAERGGFTVRVLQVSENRLYRFERTIEVPWSNKKLSLRWEHFSSKLQPGQKETWTLVVAGPEAARSAAELVATLYDASLDAFLPHRWPQSFPVFAGERSWISTWFGNEPAPFAVRLNGWRLPSLGVRIRYRSFPPEINPPMPAGLALRAKFGRGAGPSAPVADVLMAAAAPMEGAKAMVAEESTAKQPGRPSGAAEANTVGPWATDGGPGGTQASTQAIDWSQVKVRRNLQETAFFFPHLTTDAEGRVRLTFTLPEALTEWRFLGFAHTRDLAAGLLEGSTVTALDLMVQPNPPRFLREGDLIEFTAKVTNQSDQPQRGRITLHWWNALTDEPVDAALHNAHPEREFLVPPGQSRVTAWRLRVPDGLTGLRYRVMAASEQHADGQEGLLPVLARRVLVRESFPLALRGPGERQVVFESLLHSAESDSLAHHSLTLQMVSNPAWYAILALPYLMEYPHECIEQTFNRYYANALARFIANSDPRIRRVFDQWKNTPALDSPLAKNQELKNILLQETPWWDEAQDESQARRQVGLLFDDNRLNNELRQAWDKLCQAQYADGVWPWFPGGPRNDYITLYIVTGFGRLRHLGVPVDVQPALRALNTLDAWLKETHDRIHEKGDPEANHLSPRIALQLYGRSFFLDDHPIQPAYRRAYDYFLEQARRHWVKLSHRQSQGHLALGLLRFGDRATAEAIVRSLRERSVVDEEMGRFWRDTERSWWWYRAPIETQALMIEVFDEVAHDAEAVEECQIWLLKQKQTRDWQTTKATADAVYALLLRGRNWLANRSIAEVQLGGLDVTPGRFHRPGRTAPQIEAGTGAYEVRFSPEEIRPEMARIHMRQPEPGIAWGGLHWAYYEDLAKVRPYAETRLQLELHRKRSTPDGPVLEPVRGPVHVGEELVLRLVLRADRDMEYVHLKLPRGSGTEPVEVLSGYRFQDGLGYYQSIRDTATHCFIDYLPKGTYVFEHSLRVQLRGRYETGFATLQCMYAPEFSSHSASLTIEVE